MWTGDCSKVVRASNLPALDEGREMFQMFSSLLMFLSLQVAMPGSKRSVEVDEVEDLSQLE